MAGGQQDGWGCGGAAWGVRDDPNAHSTVGKKNRSGPDRREGYGVASILLDREVCANVRRSEPEWVRAGRAFFRRHSSVGRAADL